MINLFRSTALLLLFPVTLSAQKFTATPASSRNQLNLDSHFSNYGLFELNTSAVRQYIKTRRGTAAVELEFPGYANWKMQLQEHDILSADYTLTVSSPSGIQKLPRPDCITYTG